MENVDHGLLEHWLLNIRNVVRLHNEELQVCGCDCRFLSSRGRTDIIGLHMFALSLVWVFSAFPSHSTQIRVTVYPPPLVLYGRSGFTASNTRSSKGPDTAKPRSVLPPLYTRFLASNEDGRDIRSKSNRMAKLSAGLLRPWAGLAPASAGKVLAKP